MISKIKSIWHFTKSPNKGPFFHELLRSIQNSNRTNVDLKKNIAGSYQWLCRAQDATPDDGVAALYDLIRGWMPSYPETTGYIIPTFLTYAKVMSHPDAKERAMKMADWEIDVQLPTGAIRSGSLAAKKVGPAVFNTGQVLFGWVEAYKETSDKRYADAIQRAASWLIQEQDGDGAWRRNLSLMTSSKVQTYNARSAWGLAMAGNVLNEQRWIEAARKNGDWVLTQQQENGWFLNNAFSEQEPPLLHTIGYVLEGLTGLGELLDNERYLSAAQRGIQPLVEIYKKSGGLKGRYDGQWKSSVSWRCLTGEAQVALTLHRLSKHVPQDYGYSETCHALLEGIARNQDVGNRYPETSGGLSGSYPVWGAYIPWCYLNWAVKFYMDALLLDIFNADVHALNL